MIAGRDFDSETGEIHETELGEPSTQQVGTDPAPAGAPRSGRLVDEGGRDRTSGAAAASVPDNPAAPTPSSASIPAPHPRSDAVGATGASSLPSEAAPREGSEEEIDPLVMPGFMIRKTWINGKPPPKGAE